MIITKRVYFGLMGVDNKHLKLTCDYGILTQQLHSPVGNPDRTSSVSMPQLPWPTPVSCIALWGRLEWQVRPLAFNFHITTEAVPTEQK